MLFKTINFIFTTHTINYIHGKFPTIMLAYVFPSSTIFNIYLLLLELQTGSSPRCPHFSTSALILWYHKTGTQISHTNFNCFQNSNIPVHNLLVELCTGILFLYLLFIVPLQKARPFRFLVYLLLSKNSIFHLYISKDLTICREISLQTLKQYGFH